MQTYFFSQFKDLPATKVAAFCCALLMSLSFPAAAAPKVVTSIKPVYLLTKAVVQDIAQVDLLVDGFASPHTYQLRPSQALSLHKAELVIWVGAPLETFLHKSLTGLEKQTRIISVLEIPGLKLWPARVGGVWDTEDGHQHEDEHLQLHLTDPHAWLNPDNALLIAAHIASVLSEQDVKNAQAYADNLQRFNEAVAVKKRLWQKMLAPLAKQPFVVFHDAFQYLEKYYSLNALGAVAVNPERRPSGKRILTLRQRIAATGAKCIFREPQFDSNLLFSITEDTGVQTGLLDPLGGELGKSSSWIELFDNNVQALNLCLGR